MIGVVANPAEQPVVREFFELFKVPWQFHRSNADYDIVLSSGNCELPRSEPRVLISYGSRRTDLDVQRGVPIAAQPSCSALSFRKRVLPIYGKLMTFSEGPRFLTDKEAGLPATYVCQDSKTTFVRVGYDLFDEIQTLLATGQPPENAAVPALDLHIDLLRDLITATGLPLIEVPPVPAGCSFISCLTHDLDHPLMRRHRFDSTTFGFLYRATIGSAINVARGRLSMRKLFTNVLAAAKLPFVHLGVAEDPWYQFDRYVDLEQGRPSTFFIIPFENRPGRSPEPHVSAPAARRTRYDISHVEAKVPRLLKAGCEVGLHGIDAWSDSASAREEADRISAATGTHTAGVRMHWLYSDQSAPKALEQAGFAYDSTTGYNHTVGYRAGTAQPFKPLGASRLLELPLLLMDTALFYPDYMNFSEEDAWAHVTPFLDYAAEFGGAFTVNWHDRSIAPERLWEPFYLRLLEELIGRGASFCTASQAVTWFRKRRSLVFTEARSDEGEVTVAILGGIDEPLPGFRLRRYEARTIKILESPADPARNYSDTYFTTNIDICLPNLTDKVSIV
jgi:hypothetical protein